ncbi:MAG: endonuclease III [Roseiflexaceae bacterium]|nr:endonuclease III [Roseiflexaceae bacterium]
MDVNQTKIMRVYQRLVDVYGPRSLRPSRAPLDELIHTILSQNTSDINSGRAFGQLRAAYPHWEELLDAPDDELYALIKGAGLGRIKAARINRTLHAVLEQCGALDLTVLSDLPLAEAKRWLTSLDGIGPKTAACVLLFALGRPALPVDTHVHRVSLRMGLIAPRIGADAAHSLLEAALPEAAVYSFHLDMIRHGKQVCKAQRPLCGQCPLRDLCDYYV